ncbi:zinc metalloprotease HtpX, partial [Candidatus Roizmanbacteria bacterium CG09_land_8_20_14_0_10_41_9]
NQISSNRYRTFLIFFVFIFLFTGFFYVLGKYTNSSSLYIFFGLAISFISSFASYFYSDKIILFTVGAIPANKSEYFDYYTVAENIAIASRIPMPRLYVIENPAPNAFATGRSPKHAIVCVTTGLLELLNRAELEGVVAHEMGHIKDYDILLSSVVAVLVGSLAIISDWVMRNLWWVGISRDNDDNRRGNPISLIFFIAVIVITPIVATLIQLAVSRQREYLADATGALTTRYPEGLARALEKISSSPHVLSTASTSTAHLFIVNPFKKRTSISNWFLSLFSTHPPVEERIKILRSM